MSKYVCFFLLSARYCLFLVLFNSVYGKFQPPGKLSSFPYPNEIEEWSLVPWINDDIKLGQVSGVSIDTDDHIYLFHRADRVWDNNSFDENEVYTKQNLGPINKPTIFVFDKDGALLGLYGFGMFYLPHGITVDNDFNIWLTDVALHQVIKLSPRTKTTPLILGEKFVPGMGLNQFCKPTSVAVTSSGDFFVADGYCNSRIIKYNSEGKKILEWGRANNFFHPPGKYDLYVPHALTLAEERGIVCTADRENGRVVCYRIDTGDYVNEIVSSSFGTKVFSVAYSSASDGQFFIVNGKSSETNVPVQGFVLNPSSLIVGKFGSNLITPHDVAVSSNGNSIYVVEIGPYKAWKYVKKECNMSSTSHPIEDTSIESNVSNTNSIEGLTGAVLVTVSCFIFAVGLLIAVLIFSKSRKSATSDTRRLLSNVDY